jgi:hypothetical protein
MPAWHRVLRRAEGRCTRRRPALRGLGLHADRVVRAPGQGAKTAAPAPTTTAAARTAPPVICAARAGLRRISSPRIVSVRRRGGGRVGDATRRLTRRARRAPGPSRPSHDPRATACFLQRSPRRQRQQGAAITTPACTSAVRHASPACASGRSATVPVIRHSFPSPSLRRLEIGALIEGGLGDETERARGIRVGAPRARRRRCRAPRGRPPPTRRGRRRARRRAAVRSSPASGAERAVRRVVWPPREAVSPTRRRRPPRRRRSGP